MARRTESAPSLDQLLMACVGLLLGVLSWALSNIHDSFSVRLDKLTEQTSEINRRLYFLEATRQGETK